MLGLCLLPQGKVSLVLLLADTGQFTTLILDILQRTTTQDAVLKLLVVGLDIEIDGAIRFVGKTIVQNLLYQLLLLDDMTCSMRFDRRAQHVQRIHILMVAVGIVLGNLHRLQLFQTSLLGYLVLTLVGIVFQMTYVGDVTDVAHLIA